ncbi:hypothetical protein [Actinocrispum sp. NPDC049592]|uniref:hypothetical protein n=1 Tax=Actinocrispum sp. NPDC049592 TaxID=3154835 RepID=UPI00341B4FD8
MSKLERIATFCGQCNCGCPELWIDPDAPDEQRVVITDDFGQRIQMSLAQLHVLVSDVKDGALDALLATSSS